MRYLIVTSIEFAQYLTKKGYKDDAISKFSIAIRTQIESVYPRFPLLGNWDSKFDLVVLDFLCEMFKSISFLNEVQCDSLERDCLVRSLWLNVYNIYWATLRYVTLCRKMFLKF